MRLVTSMYTFSKFVLMYFSRLIGFRGVLLSVGDLGFRGFIIFDLLSFFVMLFLFSHWINASHLCFQISLFSFQNLLIVVESASLAVCLLPMISSAILSIWFVATPLIISVKLIPCHFSRGVVLSLLIWVFVHWVCISCCCVFPSALLLHSSVIIVMNLFLSSVLLFEHVNV